MSAPAAASAAHARGFTLIEVMVALVIVALGMSALLEALSVSAGNVSALRDKTVAEWIAMNKIADVRLALNAPAIGTTQGDIADCAHGTWHWRQDVNAVSAIPGLVNITVSVRRTGNSVSKPSTTSNTTAGATPSATSNLQRGLGGPSSLGATGPLGSVQNLGANGCIANAEPGGSLGGAPTLGAPGTLGAPSSLNSSPQLGSRSATPGSLGASGALGAPGSSQGGSNGAAVNGSALAASNAAGAQSSASSSAGSSSNGSSSSDSSSGAPVTWLVTLTGFRGTAIGGPSGEMPNWAVSSAFPAPPGPNQNNNGQNGNGSNTGLGANGGVGTAPTLGPQTPPGNSTSLGNQSQSTSPPESPR